MEFIKEDMAIHLSSLSKSFAENYDSCKLRAWKKKRHNRDAENKYMQVGLAAHAMFAEKIAKRVGEKYKVHKITDPSVRLEAENIIKKVNFERLLVNSEIIGYEDRAEALLDNGMSLIGIFDLVLLVDDPIVGQYINIVDFKTSFVVKKEIDNEAIYYAYLAAEKYNLPVTFTRFSGRTGDIWGQFFTFEDAIKFKYLIEPYANEVKSVIESEEEPFPEAGAHCVQCPFLDECSAKDLDDTNPRALLAKLQFAKANAKLLEEKIKNLRFENETAIETEEFVVDIKESRSNAIATKGIKKSDILILLAKAGRLEEVLGSLDIKITEQVMEKAKELGIDFKDKVTRRLEIKAREEEASNE
jgi:CRISPR/Cas system-associated exonuclease Cas4 (RecB family)